MADYLGVTEMKTINFYDSEGIQSQAILIEQHIATAFN